MKVQQCKDSRRHKPQILVGLAVISVTHFKCHPNTPYTKFLFTPISQKSSVAHYSISNHSMQKIAREFLQYRRGIILRNILENNSDQFHTPPQKHTFQPLKLFSLSHQKHKASKCASKESSTSQRSKLNQSCNQCRERLKCRRSPLPWEQSKPKGPRGVLPYRKLAEEMTGSQISRRLKPCRYCPNTEPKLKSKKTKKDDNCVPFHDQNEQLRKTTTICERRRLTRCLKTSCLPEVECKNLKPTTSKITKVYPLMDAIRKFVHGAPIPGWQKLHEKAMAECHKSKAKKNKKKALKKKKA